MFNNKYMHFIYDFGGHFEERPHFIPLFRVWNTIIAYLGITVIKTNAKSGQTCIIVIYLTHIITLYEFLAAILKKAPSREKVQDTACLPHIFLFSMKNWSRKTTWEFLPLQVAPCSIITQTKRGNLSLFVPREVGILTRSCLKQWRRQ